MTRYLTLLLTILLLAACSAPPPITVSVIGTNDVHGQFVANGERGGLVSMSGYVNAIRTARERDNGTVLLIDAGDMWQGTLESNLSEGAAMVSAFNALGYAAAAMGNHEFDFGPRGPAATPSEAGHDPRGALKERAAEANYPLLAANLVDQQTGQLVSWDNVRPFTIVEVQGIKIGIIGVMASRALQRTLALNVTGLEVTALAPAIEEYAITLRQAGAAMVIVAAHAGGECTEFDDPNDLSSCNAASEIFQVARELPAGLVDHIIAGHVHQGIAHVVNDIAITSSYSSTRAFSRVDFSLDPKSGDILERRIFPPTPVVAEGVYEGMSIEPDLAVVEIAAKAEQLAKNKREAKIGIRLDTPFSLEENPESALGNLFTKALYESLDVDVAIHNVAGGLRTGLPAGDLGFGSVYELSPFDNRAVIVDISGADLRRVIAEQAHRGRHSIGFSGMTVKVECTNLNQSVEITLADGLVVNDTDSLKLMVNDYIATGGDNILNIVMPVGGYPIDESQPLTRDIFIDWLRVTGGSINADEFDTSDNPKWIRPENLDPGCRLEN